MAWVSRPALRKADEGTQEIDPVWPAANSILARDGSGRVSGKTSLWTRGATPCHCDVAGASHTAQVEPADTAADSGLLERSAQLALLHDGLAVAAGGSGVLVLLSGEAGCGKTTLLRRFCRGRGPAGRVLWGGCDPLHTPRAAPSSSTFTGSGEHPHAVRGPLGACLRLASTICECDVWFGSGLHPTRQASVHGVDAQAGHERVRLASALWTRVIRNRGFGWLSWWLLFRWRPTWGWASQWSTCCGPG